MEDLVNADIRVLLCSYPKKAPSSSFFSVTKQGAVHDPDEVLAMANPVPYAPPAKTPALQELRNTRHFELACVRRVRSSETLNFKPRQGRHNIFDRKHRVLL